VNAVGYVRVSTDHQGSDGLGMEAQRRTLAAACEARSWELVRVFEDVAGGGRMNGRHGLARALEALSRKDADALVVAKLDRLARSVGDFARTVERAEREGWRLVILDPEIDLATPFGRAMAGVIAVFAQLERDMTSERTKAALAVAKAKGKQLGLPQSHRITEPVVQRIAELRESGLSWRAVARALDAEGVRTAFGKARWSAYSAQQAYLRFLSR
jgi:DNA invertase Pin-like site-specific DNA recombinase